jgi:SAM-dependent methyltransferase
VTAGEPTGSCAHVIDPVLGWRSPAQALSYLARADRIPNRTAGEEVLLGELPERCERVLDLGCGDGRLLALVRLARPDATGVAVDFSPPMLAAARERFAADAAVAVLAHDLGQPLPGAGPCAGPFDAVVSSFAIHHLPHERKQALYADVFTRLRPGGVFLNLEHVSSPTERLHRDFMAAMGLTEDDPSNQLLDVETQLGWWRAIGFADVDCLWKWRELALLRGSVPAQDDVQGGEDERSGGERSSAKPSRS